MLSNVRRPIVQGCPSIIKNPARDIIRMAQLPLAIEAECAGRRLTAFATCFHLKCDWLFLPRPLLAVFSTSRRTAKSRRPPVAAQKKAYPPANALRTSAFAASSSFVFLRGSRTLPPAKALLPDADAAQSAPRLSSQAYLLRRRRPAL